jgi:WD40 repeat protein
MNIVEKEYIVKSIIYSLDFFQYRKIFYKLNSRHLFNIFSKTTTCLQIKKLYSIKAESIPIGKPQNRITMLQFLKDNKLASVGYRGIDITIWDTKGKFQLIKKLSEHKFEIKILFLLNDNNLLSSSIDNTMIIWQYADFSLLYKIQTSDTVSKILQNSMGQLITAQWDGMITIWDSYKEYNNAYSLKEHKHRVFAILLLNNNNIVSASYDDTIRIWSFKSDYECICVHKPDKFHIEGNLFINDGIIGARNHSGIIIFDESGNYNKIINMSNTNVFITCLISLQSKIFVFGCSNGSIYVFDRVKNLSYDILFSANEHHSKINFLLMHKRNKLLSGSSDKIIIRDIVKNYGVVAVVNLKTQYLDAIAIYKNRIVFSVLNSLNILI